MENRGVRKAAFNVEPNQVVQLTGVYRGDSSTDRFQIKTAGEEIYVPDTSALIEGVVSNLIVEGRIRGRVMIHRASVAELEYYALNDKVVGYAGLEEIKKLRELESKGLIKVEIVGEVPRNLVFANNNSSILTNNVVREYVYSIGAVLITTNRVQKVVSESLGVKVIYVEPVRYEGSILDSFFDDETMSIHLKENVEPCAKKGKPGEWHYVKLYGKVLSKVEIEEIANRIIEEAKRRPDGFIEIDRSGSTIVQLGGYRVIITRPPLSDGWEITAVKPIRRLKLEDYSLDPKLIDRLKQKAEGILIAGAPGMGKTTFAQALAEFYRSMGKVVKTVESPRDMILPEDITQYSKNYADIGELHDILLLSRPDYTVFDEMRSDEDFKLYADLRLAGIGMIGVVHATSPIDAIQRFIGRVELGMIPSLIDTVVFIKNGYVDKVYSVEMTVKLPTGLKEVELSRPVIEIRDYLTGELEYEIYTFGEQTVVIPVKRYHRRAKGRKNVDVFEKAQLEILKVIPEASVELLDEELVITIPRRFLRKYNKVAKRIKNMEERYGVSIKLKVSEEF